MSDSVQKNFYIREIFGDGVMATFAEATAVKGDRRDEIVIHNS